MPTPPNPSAAAVSAQFANRPSLAAVARQLLATSIAQAYPSLTLDLQRTQLATPLASGWKLEPFMPVVLEYLAKGTLPDFRDHDGRPAYLSDRPPTRLTAPDGQPLDMQVIAKQVQVLAWTLPIALQNSLASFWGTERWRWLSDVLRDTLNIGAISQPDLTRPERDMLGQLIDCPDRDQRFTRWGDTAVHAYLPHATLKAGSRVQKRLGTDLLLVCSLQSQARVLLCPSTGPCTGFNSVDEALQAWVQGITQDEIIEHITLQRYEPDGNLFDTQAAALLNQQLERLQQVKLPQQQTPDQLQALYRTLTNPASVFPSTAPHPVLQALRKQVPGWLQQASEEERARYRHYALQLASAKKRSQGRTFLSDIPDLSTFTRTALLNQLKRDQLRLEPNHTTPLLPEDLQLTFNVAAGYPGGAGFVDKVHMTLVDLAINNLQGQPRGRLTVTHRFGESLPAWLTSDYLLGSNGLIQRVDIGKTYPELLQTRLLADSEDARQRQRDFAAQTEAQLPLQALELSLRRQHGFTPQGAAYVAALMNTDQRQVDGQTIVIRHLALVRKPQVAADGVSNMYIIEPESAESGVHILYRPLYADALQQFPSRQAMLDAIARPGELQDSVLAWLSDSARPIYANGGFHEPHYVRFGLGSEFDTPEIPKPVTLATDGISDELLQFLANGHLMQYLYGCNARALVDQADRETVSNAESRWKILLEGASLLFNTLLLPLARGPFMLAGWLFSLMDAASKDLPALNSQDPIARELAVVDLLLNVGMLMFQMTPSSTAPVIHEHANSVPTPSPFAARRAEQWPQPPEPVLQQGPVLLESQGLTDTVFDFSFSSARDQLSPSQQEHLWRLQAPKPQTLPEPVLNGPRRGLYHHLRDWYALIEHRWYQVRLETEGGVVIVDPFDTTRLGPYLQTDGHGHWSLDLRLRLLGGMPPKRIAAARERKALRTQQLVDEQALFLNSRQQALQTKVDMAQQLMHRAASNTQYSDAARANTRTNFDRALHEQINAYQALLDSRQERMELGIPMPVNAAAVFLENTVNNARKSVVVADMDRQALYAEHPDFSCPYEQALPSIIANPAHYAQFLMSLSRINERQIQALELKDRHLLELFNVGQPGLDAFNRLTLNRPDELSALSLKYLQLQNLKYLSRRDWRAGLFTNELDLALDPLGPHLRTHSELNLLNLSPADRMAVLDSLFLQYGQAVDALQGVALVHAEALDNTYFQPLQALVTSLYQDVLLQLAAEVKPSAEMPKSPPKRAMTAPGKPQKKVIKTRRQGILIGDVKPAGSTLPIEVVEVRTEQANELLVTYSQHESGWDEVLEQRRPSAPAPDTRALNVIKGEARKRVKDLAAIIQRQEGYATMSRFPIEIQESLENEAARFTELAGELERAIAALAPDLQLTADRNLAAELRSASDTMIAKGHELRVQRTLELPPTDSHVAYLLGQDKIQLASLGPRVAMRGERKDFIQEYAVNDKRGFPLWYAHFHYAKADTPKAEYSVAHLKTKAQRTESYYSLLNKAQSPQSVVDVHRGGISRELAERRFLPLAP
ncbi:hypothetical protein [Pseudomonas sp. BIGb0164]|uniref:hypothetical protein n=1 Tax=Pseudomonas sp. BIGb0164 TaxID=2940605 RepID=UPI0021699C43|nr:hypothetical protein [Pseudomonas sp. BIGb0164]MCS4251431.1 hypothetical protein [Pseudomonas sp. BIGb0164]